MHPQAPAWGLQQAIELELVMQEIETVPVAAALLEAIRELDVSGWSYGSIEGGKRYGKATVSDKKLAATLREQRPQLAAGSSSASLRKEVGEARQLLLGKKKQTNHLRTTLDRRRGRTAGGACGTALVAKTRHHTRQLSTRQLLEARLQVRAALGRDCDTL